MINTQTPTPATSKQLTISDLTRLGLMWIVGWLEITPLPQTARMDSALAAMESHLSTWPEDLDRYVLDTPASEYRSPVTNLDKVRQAYAARYGTALRHVDLADYGHAGFHTDTPTTLPASQYGMPNPS